MAEESERTTWWNPSDDPIRNLVKAGALIAAEIDRQLRAQAIVAVEREIDTTAQIDLSLDVNNPQEG